MNSTQIQWQVQVFERGRWVKKGLFETRAAARDETAEWRNGFYVGETYVPPYGFGNTRTVRYVKGRK